MKRKRLVSGGRTPYGKSCASCRTAHRTCDGKRPCARCVSFDIASGCVDSAKRTRGSASKNAGSGHDLLFLNTSSTATHRDERLSSLPPSIFALTTSMSTTHPLPQPLTRLFSDPPTTASASEESVGRPLDYLVQQQQQSRVQLQLLQQSVQLEVNTSSSNPHVITATPTPSTAMLSVVLEELQQLKSQQQDQAEQRLLIQQQHQLILQQQQQLQQQQLQLQHLIQSQTQLQHQLSPQLPYHEYLQHPHDHPQQAIAHMAITPPRIHSPLSEKSQFDIYCNFDWIDKPIAPSSPFWNSENEFEETDPGHMPFIINDYTRPFLLIRKIPKRPKTPDCDLRTNTSKQIELMSEPLFAMLGWTKVP
eukprot:TRINITY_DN3160_c2_g1_i1.p1 TRINITY_DN3160_c2_g1~~TRINITY_DN3160_c2_g1_i1.p1  ORF type:complete len:363 (+),score=88.05 TRINITY_DN3160_c2_g1_i1:2-1090(+)